MNEKSGVSGRWSRFIKRNGIFLALAVSVLLMGAVVIAGVTQRLSKSGTADEPDVQQQVEQTVTGEKDTRVTSTTTTVGTVQKSTQTTHYETATLYRFPGTNTVQKEFSAESPIYCETMMDWRLHLGTDFSCDEGMEIKAAADGVVASVEEDPLWGPIVTIDHGLEVITRYCGVVAVVEVGDEVELGDLIGHLTTIPCESAQSAHLHFEMSVEDVPVDPVAAIALDVRYEELDE